MCSSQGLTPPRSGGVPVEPRGLRTRKGRVPGLPRPPPPVPGFESPPIAGPPATPAPCAGPPGLRAGPGHSRHAKAQGAKGTVKDRVSKVALSPCFSFKRSRDAGGSVLGVVGGRKGKDCGQKTGTLLNLRWTTPFSFSFLSLKERSSSLCCNKTDLI